MFLPDQLIFVYNADAGVLNALRDTIHKTLSPKTYECNLCVITYSTIRMHSAWSDFVKGLTPEPVFTYRSELQGEFPEADLPVVFRQGRDGLSVFIEAHDLNKINSVDELVALVRQRIKN